MHALSQHPPEVQSPLVAQVQQDITEEIFKAMKFPRWQAMRDIFRPLFHKPTLYFSEIIAETDYQVGRSGIVQTAQQLLSRLVRDVRADGWENIPAEGPVVIASNHPGTYDALALISQIPRDDIKLIVSGIPFFNDLPNAGQHFIYSTRDTSVRADAIRKSIQHLRDGGSLLIFPSGRIDPDPAVLPEAAENLGRWSRSLGVFLNKVQNSKLVLAITSGVLSTEFIDHPFPRLFKNDHERRRIIEFMQVIRQMINKKPLDLQPKVSFSTPLALGEISNERQPFDPANVVKQARLLLNAHLNRYYLSK